MLPIWCLSLWYWVGAGLFLMTISCGVFLYIVTFVIQANETLSFLTLLIPLLPGLLLTIFAGWYAYTNQRQNEIYKKNWSEMKGMISGNTSDIKTICEQLQKDIEKLKGIEGETN